jgi:hypothetical protein
LFDRSDVRLSATVRDKKWKPLPDALVEARVSQPDGTTATVPMEPVAGEPGVYRLDYSARVPGTYIAEVVSSRDGEELGRDLLSFRREDGVAEGFGRQQNRDLLQLLSDRTNGNYYTPADASRIPDEITFSQAGLTIRENRELWNLPLFFLLLILLKAGEWLLRRRWGSL